VTRKPKTISFWQGRLPHWEVEDGRYYITIHVRGAIPAPGRLRLRQISAELVKQRPRTPEWLKLQRKIFGEMERWLDCAKWAPHFASERMAQMVVEAIEHRHLRGDWHVFEYVVMPTHVHLFCDMGPQGMKATLKDFKRWTGHRAMEILPGLDANRFWQREWFDHWSRSDVEDERIVEYIRHNPVKARLIEDFRRWQYGSWSRRQ
jgi:REP element-mobilizing transposase RayT